MKKLQKLTHRSLVVCCMASTLCASLMLTPEEVSILQAIVPEDNGLLEVDEVTNLNPCVLPEILFLSAILYFKPTHWTVWINDKTYTADDNEDSLIKLVKVTQHLVEFELKDYFKKMNKMRANQSLITLGRRIVDGDARVKFTAAQL